MANRMWVGCVLVVASTVAMGCEESEVAGASSTALDGRDVYENRLDDGNSFACTNCHALQEPAADGLRRPGHSLGDAANRPTYKNGQLTSLRDAVNTCVTEWMIAEPLAEDDPRWLALESFLQDLAGDAAAEPIVIDLVTPPADLDGGDAIAGMALFNDSCAGCHGQDAVGGTQLAPGLIGARLDAETIARRIRTSGPLTTTTYDGVTGGLMPFWGADRLSDGELLDLVAYVEQIGTADREAVDGESGPLERQCEATHPKVGQIAELSTFAHLVAGTATIVDDCTITIENFSFDGGGVNVQIYGGEGRDFDPPVGFSISDNLLGQVFDAGTLTVQLPEGRTLDDLDAISVWCVPVGVSFGDGQFADPN